MDILEKIALNKRMEIEELKINLPLERFKDDLPDKEPFRLSKALSKKDNINIIAEIKKGSPSKGIISEDFNPAELAGQYKDGGAAALSVLTESKYFFGNYDYIDLTAKEAGLPILCKDFIIDRYQIYHAKYINADAVLLIVKMLTPEMLKQLNNTALEIGIDTLVETHSDEELDIALEAGIDIIGVNNRNLSTFEVDLQTSIDLAKHIPADRIKVAESGIFSFDDIKRLQEAGYNNFLIGEALVKSENPIKLLKSLRGYE